MSDHFSDPTHGKKAPSTQPPNIISPEEGESPGGAPAGEEATRDSVPSSASAPPPAGEEPPPTTSGSAFPASTPPAQSPVPLEELRAISDELAHEFPMPVEETELVLMDVDPHRLHAYWNVANADVTAARQQAGALGAPEPLVLRFHDITPAEGGMVQHDAPFEVEVQGLQSNAYVDLWSDGKAYWAELGVRSADGSLQRLASSNTIQLPRASQSPIFASPAADGSAGPMPASPPTHERNGMPVTTPPPQEQAEAALAPGVSEQPSAPPGEARSLLVEEPLAQGAAPVRSAAIVPDGRPADPTLIAVSDEGLVPVFPNVAQEGSRASSAALPGDLEPAETPPPESSGRAGAMDRAPDAPLPVEPVYLPPAVELGMRAPAHDDLAATRELSHSAPSGSESIVTFSSSSLGQPGVELELNAEIHLFGRAKPGARITIYGRPVTLRPDGSFSLRKPLPSGALVVPLLMAEGDPSGKPGGG